MKKYRLDQLLVERKLIENIDQAYRVILAGMVRVNGQLADKPGHKFAIDVDIHMKELLKYVSRGGLKIEGAYEEFKFDLNGSICIDIGASTGGFTDFMLQQGASKVYAIDCGTNQLHYRLRQDSRVIVLENTNARYISEKEVPELADFCSIDTSFISLTIILPPLKKLIKPGGKILSLIKPQFEAERSQVEDGGVVRSHDVHNEVIEKIKIFGQSELGFTWLGLCSSPITGPAGNIEYFAYWQV